jgi:hypothetical protein
MQLPDFGQLLANVDPLTIVVAVVVGLVLFFLLRAIIRTFHFVVQLGCLAIIIVGILYLLQSAIK